MTSSQTVEITDALDQVVDGVRNLAQIIARKMFRRDALNVRVDFVEPRGNVWGDTPGATWGRHPDSSRVA